VIRRIHVRNAAQAMIDNANSATAASSAGRAEWADVNWSSPKG
jgi:hypothetical protein